MSVPLRNDNRFKLGIFCMNVSHGTTMTKSFRIKTDRPVSAYTIWPYGGALSYVSTATMLYPTYSLGSNYVLLDAWLESIVGKPGFQVVDQLAAQGANSAATINPHSAIVPGFAATARTVRARDHELGPVI